MHTQEIIQNFNGKLVGTDFMKNVVSQTLKKLPEEIMNYLTKHCWFLSSLEDAYAYTFNGNDIKDKHFIFLSDELLNQDLTTIQYNILHEIGHVILKHRNEIGFKQSKVEIKKQELEADKFAKSYLKNGNIDLIQEVK
ncbi:hypothetical protein HY025_02990 [Candidatus Daviesbacteria bacterium]|nr:hypothetical protein [Candidatus Daviesbacteria bacterium]